MILFFGSTEHTSESIVSSGNIKVGGAFSPFNTMETSVEHLFSFISQKIFIFSVNKFSVVITDNLFK